MAISYYTGIPRSGKTYKAVLTLYDSFIRPPSKNFFGRELPVERKYYNAYTNINGFNFDLCKDINKLEFDILYSNLSILHDLYMKKFDDDVLIEKCKDLNLYKTIFVIDECHNFFAAKKDPVLLWWLTYHGHLYHEIILITQDIANISAEYKNSAEYFYKTVPQRFRLNKNTFVYFNYSSSKYYKSDVIGKEKFKSDPKIFDMYVSGASNNSPSMLKKFIFIIFFLLILAVYAFYNFSSQFENDEIIEDNKLVKVISPGELNSSNLPELPIPNIETNSSESIKDIFMHTIICYTSSCKSLDFDSKNIPIKFFSRLISNLEKKDIHIEKKLNHIKFYIISTPEKFDFLKSNTKAKDEKDNPRSTLFN